MITSAFAYAISRFTGQNYAAFSARINGKDIPVRVGCGDRKVVEFVNDVSGVIHGNTDATMSCDESSDDSSIPTNIVIAPVSAAADLETDLLLTYADTNKRTQLTIRSSEKYSRAFTERFLDVVLAIIDSMGRVDKLSEIEYTSKKDIKILNELNKTDNRLLFTNIMETFKKNVATNPDNVLVTYLGCEYSFGKSDRITDGMANALRMAGVHANDTVAILVPRSEWYLLSIIAVLKIGGTYVPIDDSHPLERIRYILSDSCSKTVITSRSEYDRMFNEAGLDSECRFVFVEDIAEDGESFKCNDSGPDDIFTILYTSGTTGNPKGTLITHGNVLSHLSSYVRDYGVNEKDVYSSYISYGFDATITGLILPLVTGCSVDIVPNDVRFDLNLLNTNHNDKHSKETVRNLATYYIKTVRDVIDRSKLAKEQQ